MFQGSTDPVTDVTAHTLFVPVFGDTDALRDLEWLDAASRGEIRRAREAKVFRGRTCESFSTLLLEGHCGAQRVTLVGAGPASELTAERWRRVAATSGYLAKQAAAESCAFVVRGTDQAVEAAQHVADGVTTAEFEGRSYRTVDPLPKRCIALTVVAPGVDGKALDAAVSRGRVIGECANFTRGLANEPANVLTPAVFADRVASAAKGVGLGVDVLDEARIKELGMGMLLAVSQGSVQPPRVIVIRHEPAGAPSTPVIGLVGKGVTFDTGGVSIKPADGMERMKDDMAGGAAVAGAMLALARLGAPFRAIGVIPSAENMVSGHATRPGDVVRAANGKTVEVINTDAEGRLLLGDALWYSRKLGVTHLVDVATLTGACVVALGRHVSGLMGQPQAWVDTVKSAGAEAGDRLWQLPLYDEVHDQLKSDIADIVNSAGRPGGTITAAGFLREFVDDTPWAHLDIAGTAWAETKEPYQPKGATGVALRTLIELGLTGGQARR